MKIVGVSPVVSAIGNIPQTDSKQTHPTSKEDSRNIVKESDRKTHEDRDTDLPNQILEAILRRVAKDSQYAPNEIGVMATYPNWGWKKGGK